VRGIYRYTLKPPPDVLLGGGNFSLFVTYFRFLTGNIHPASFDVIYYDVNSGGVESSIIISNLL
jgi:hypothetical protein